MRARQELHKLNDDTNIILVHKLGGAMKALNNRKINMGELHDASEELQVQQGEPANPDRIRVDTFSAKAFILGVALMMLYSTYAFVYAYTLNEYEDPSELVWLTPLLVICIIISLAMWTAYYIRDKSMTRKAFTVLSWNVLRHETIRWMLVFATMEILYAALWIILTKATQHSNTVIFGIMFLQMAIPVALYVNAHRRKRDLRYLILTYPNGVSESTEIE